MAIDRLLEEFTVIWDACSVDFVPPGRKYSEGEQAGNALELARARERIRRDMPAPGAPAEERAASNERIAAAFVQFARSGLALEERHAALLLDAGFTGVAPALEEQARALDPGVGDAEILQACRNAWTACALQCLFGAAMELTPSIFAYSMLYPYSDNYLDNDAADNAAKLNFSRRFGRRLRGEPVAAEGAHEKTVWRLVALIESQYARDVYPPVFESLLDIHHGQEESLRLLAECRNPLPLIFSKGGASVVADAFLAVPRLGECQQTFAFAWGVLLQLGDDLQDVAEDRADGCVTLFSAAAAKGTLDELTNRTFHFARAVMRLLYDLPGPLTPKELIERSTFSLLVRAAGKHAELYSPAYIAALESYSPVRFQIGKALAPRMLDTRLRSQHP